MFINDKYGGHLSKFGNKFVAKIINDELKIMKSNNEKTYRSKNNFDYWKKDGLI